MLMAVFCLGASLIGINAQEKDWANLQRYAQQNAELPKPDKNEKRVVFMGNSITEGWVNTHPDFFKSNGYIGRGIGGQTSYQFLVRFREDVINLSPALVVINAATNDIAENTGAYHEDRTFGNIVSMVELAKANHIKVILTTTLPAAAFRHGWEIREEMLTFTPGIVRGLAFAIHCFTEKGDKVMVMPPVYHPFFLVTQKNEREVVYSPLVLKDGQYHIDFDRFRKDVQGCKLLILSNPHNPGGRVWTKEELSQIADICYENGTLVISDEIHADLTLPPYKHPTFALISEKARMNSLVFMSPSKAFNMPGLASSYAIIENDELRHQFQVYMEASEFSEGHLFAYLSVAAAYSHGTEWLDQVIAYIKGNIDFTESYLKERIPAIRMIRPQASYLIFLDCRELGLSQEELNRLFVEDAHLALNEGTTFGKEGEGFMRLNVACPRATLEKALRQLEQAVTDLK